jgi:phosphoserine phosphatase RsbU/P
VTDLIVKPKKGEPYVIPLAGKRLTFGRSPSCDVALSDQFTSGCHVAIFPKGSGYALIDQGSKNGTFINNRRVSGEVDLSRGDEILVGETRIIFDRESQTSVQIVDTTFTSGSNTIIQVKDILRKPPSAIIPKASGVRIEVDRLAQDQKFVGVLSEVSQALIYHMPLDKLLDHIMDLITQNIPMDRGVLMLREGRADQLVQKVVRVQNGLGRSQNILVSKSIIRTALDKNSAVLISDIGSEEQLKGQVSVIQTQIHSAMCVPLWNNEKIIGLIYCDRASLRGQFSEDDLKLLTLLSNLAAVKIENARLIEVAIEEERMKRELETAARIQSNFLPQADPAFEPYDISGNTRACTHVGGDYYDFIPIDGARLGIVIADVSGTGVSAALLMASVRASLHAEIPVTQDLSLLAAKLNDFVHKSSDSHSFISFFFGVLDREKEELRYVNAGHNPPLLVDPSGGVRTLDSTGFCLGMFPAVSYETRALKLGPGEILCLFTDGIVESRNKDREEYGDSRLVSRLRESAGLRSHDIIERIYEDTFGFASCAEPGDDMTLVVIKGRNGRTADPAGPAAPPVPGVLKVRADLKDVDRVRDFLRDNLLGLDLAEEDVLKLELSLHEIFVNIAMYAYPDGEGEMSLRVWKVERTLFMEFRDRGVPFNPAEHPVPDLEQKIRHGERGGLGVFLFKTLMDGYAYKREADQNILTIFKKV